MRTKRNIVFYGKNLKNLSKSSVIDVDKMLFNVSFFPGRHFNYEIGRFSIGNNSELHAGKNVEIRAGSKMIIDNKGILTIGDNSMFNLNSSIYCYYRITIGKDCLFSQNVILRDSDIHKIEGKQNFGEIIIGNHCWIGTNVIILKNVHIGDNVIIGAGSVVTKDIPSNCVAVGNPAKVIRTNVVWSR